MSADREPVRLDDLSPAEVAALAARDFAGCPVCGSADVLLLPPDWQAEVVAGGGVDIVGCGNPWHYRVRQPPPPAETPLGDLIDASGYIDPEEGAE